MFRNAVTSTPSPASSTLHAAGAARIEHADPLVAVGHQRLGQVADAEILRLADALLASASDRWRDGLLGAVQFVAALEFTVFESRRCAPVKVVKLCSCSACR